MANYSPHTLVTFGGILNTFTPDKEIWQCGVRVQNGAAGPLTDPAGYLLGIEAALAEWWTGPIWTSAQIPSTCQLTWVKANNIGSDGKYTEDTTHVYDYSPTVLGSSVSNPVMPDILGVAISWSTRKAIRRHSYATHGRIYMPGYLNTGVHGSMRLESGGPAAWLLRGVALLKVLAPATWPGGVVPVIASGHAAEVEPITGVRVGDVYDVQRRRKSALNEVYVSAPYVSG